jgi:hypothetical protein
MYASRFQAALEATLATWVTHDDIDLFRECSRLSTKLQIACLLGPDINERFPDLKDLMYEFDTLAVHHVVVLIPWCLTEKGTRFRNAR